MIHIIFSHFHSKFVLVQTHLDDFDDKAEREREGGKDENDADDDHEVSAHSLTFLACWGPKS